MRILGSKFSNNFFPKSQLGFRFWTFFLSIFEKGKHFPKNVVAKMTCEHNAAETDFKPFFL